MNAQDLLDQILPAFDIRAPGTAAVSDHVAPVAAYRETEPLQDGFALRRWQIDAAQAFHARGIEGNRAGGGRCGAVVLARCEASPPHSFRIMRVADLCAA